MGIGLLHRKINLNCLQGVKNLPRQGDMPQAMNADAERCWPISRSRKKEVGKPKTMKLKQFHTPRAPYGKPLPIIRYTYFM